MVKIHSLEDFQSWIFKTLRYHHLRAVSNAVTHNFFTPSGLITCLILFIKYEKRIVSKYEKQHRYAEIRNLWFFRTKKFFCEFSVKPIGSLSLIYTLKIIKTQEFFLVNWLVTIHDPFGRCWELACDNWWSICPLPPTHINGPF